MKNSTHTLPKGPGTSPTGPGLYGLPESPQQFQARIMEINRLELLIKLQALTDDEREGLARQIEVLKGANDNRFKLND